MLIRAAPSGHHYSIDIAGAGAPLLLLHGFTGDSATWRDVARGMSDDFRLIRLDILGHGKSDKPAETSSYQMAAVAADIIDLLDQLEITEARLLGYSMGGRLALVSGAELSRAFCVARAGKRIAGLGGPSQTRRTAPQ